MILLDTHAAVWFLRHDASLGRKARSMALASLEAGQLAISAISFWELALLISKRRLRSLHNPAQQRRQILESGILEIPVTGDIAVLAVEIENLGNDPADRFIIATAMLHDATLITADERLLKWQSKLKRHDAET